MAARIHHRLVYIHPFENGNGRFVRLIADRFLLAWRCPHPLWPNLNQEGAVRKDYIQTLKHADRGDYAPLVDYMKKLGACDPKLSELLRDNFYRICMKGKRGSAIIHALVRSGSNPNDETSNGHRSMQLAIKAHLDEIVKILADAGAEIDVIDRSGLTPYQTALVEGNKTLADFFLSRGAKDLAPPGLGYVNRYNLYKK
jgi:hypothetical protein